MNYNDKFKFISKGDWFKKGSICEVQDGSCLWSKDGEEKEFSFEELKDKERFMGIFEGVRVCEDNPNEKGLGFKPGDERLDGELCGLEEFEIEKK